MDIILDTHTFLWLANGDGTKLSNNARKALESVDNRKMVSIATFWEIAIKLNIGKLELKRGFESLVAYAREFNFRILLVTLDHVQTVKDLDLIHRDPFDRILVAQASVEGVSIVTGDKNIHQYKIKTI